MKQSQPLIHGEMLRKTDHRTDGEAFCSSKGTRGQWDPVGEVHR